MTNCNGVKACAICGRQVGCSCQLHYNAKTGQCVCCSCDPGDARCKRSEQVSPNNKIQSMLDSMQSPSVVITSATARITHGSS